MIKLNRREFLQGSSTLLTLASFGLLGMDFNTKSGPLKVALIGAGWYGKSDLFRLIQENNWNRDDWEVASKAKPRMGFTFKVIH